ncbi:hypothetical protein [uncultured Rikenella sp.]|uniref:hypothetical protein n=1 Tax=uncultured Rikenella sp. TaxID=368003 RepID=UPI0025FC97DA|nr:hypothetical protein [uncultured Rikenella sp.]
MLSSFFCAHRSCGNFIIAVLLPHFQAPGSIRSTYSAPGYRNYSSGVPGGVGHSGYSWSSAVSGIIGRFLHFNAQSLTLSNADYRSYGFQLRCLSE